MRFQLRLLVSAAMLAASSCGLGPAITDDRGARPTTDDSPGRLPTGVRLDPASLLHDVGQMPLAMFAWENRRGVVAQTILEEHGGIRAGRRRAERAGSRGLAPLADDGDFAVSTRGSCASLREYHGCAAHNRAAVGARRAVTVRPLRPSTARHLECDAGATAVRGVEAGGQPRGAEPCDDHRSALIGDARSARRGRGR